VTIPKITVPSNADDNPFIIYLPLSNTRYGEAVSGGRFCEKKHR
jgi:hypothetical protein